MDNFKNNNRPGRPVGVPTGARRPSDRPAGAGRTDGTMVKRPAGARRAGEGAAGKAADGTRRAANRPDSTRPNGARRPEGTANVRRTGERPVSGRRPTGNSPRPDGRPAGRKPQPNDKKTEMMKLRAKRRKQKKTVIFVCCILIALLLVVGIVSSICKALAGDDKTPANGTPTVTASPSGDSNQGGGDNTEPTKTPEATPTPTVVPSQATLVAFGDDLVHTGVFRAGHKSDGTYDYSVLFKGVKPLVEAADISILNQETIFGGDDKGPSSYPKFNTPTAIGDAAVEAGFNVITHATNHALDMDLKGLLNAVKFWKEKHPDVTMVGIYETAEEQKNIAVMEVNGIKIAILNYTYSHNWETFSTAAEGHLNMLCAYDEKTRKIDFNTINPQVIEDIKKAEEIAEFTIVCPHWGIEYVHNPTEQEKNFAKLMTEAGADLILGTHPHVIQPVDWVTSDNGNKCLVYYSLGNFTSTQDEWERILGGMAQLTIKKDNNGVYIDPESVKAVPVVTHYVYPGWNGATVVDSTYLLKDYTTEMAAKHGLKNRCGITVTRDNLVKLSQKVFGDYCSEL